MRRNLSECHSGDPPKARASRILNYSGFWTHSLLSLARMTVFVFFFVNFVKPPSIQAAGFNQTIVRFDRMKTAAPTTGLVCASPATSATEGLVEVLFPPTYTVSTNLLNWSVSTTNIPSGATAWPGILTATGVSGQTVTFPSGDVNTGVLYCFRWNNSAALTTGTSTSNAAGRVTTLTAGSATIDSKQYFTGLTANDQVTVTARVTPDPNDINFTLSGSEPDEASLDEGEELTFTITYQSNLPYTTDLQIEANWERGLINGSSSNYVDVFDYVVGSATTSDEGAVPTVDLINRTITWNISSFAPSASHSVTFKLQTQAQFSSNLTATTHINATSAVAGETLHNRQLTYTIGGAIIPTPTSAVSQTATPGPTATDSPKATATPTPFSAITPTRVPGIPLQFDKVAITEITDTSFTVAVFSNLPVSYTLRYGTDENNLNETLQNNTLLKKHTITINNLTPNTVYYLRVDLTDANGRKARSDLFTVKTALDKSKITLTKEIVIVLSNNIILTSPTYNSLLLPVKIPLSFHVTFEQPGLIESMSASFRNKNVLGINSLNGIPAITRSSFIETIPGTFVAEIQAPASIGSYDFVLEIKDIYGGFYEKPVPYLFYISQPFTVRDQSTKGPIENASVTITKYLESSKQYASLSTIQSYPAKTNEMGQMPVVLTQGTYGISVTADTYESKRFEFTVNDRSQTYPIVDLQYQFSLTGYTTYYWKIIADLRTFTTGFSYNFFTSNRARDISIIVTLFITLLISIITISLRTNLSLLSIGLLLVYYLLKHEGTRVVVTDRKNRRVPGTKIYVLDNKNKLLFKTTSGLNGIAYIPSHLISLKSFPIKLMIYHPGYYSYPCTVDEEAFAATTIPVGLSPYEKVNGTWHWFYEVSLISFSDFSIIAAFSLALLFTRYHGIQKSLPLLVITGLLAFIWVIFIKQLHRIMQEER